jgi:hypothetical protein
MSKHSIAIMIMMGKRLFKIFFCVPHLATYIFLSFQLLNEPGLGEGIDPGMDLTPLTSSIVLDKIRTHNLPIVSRVH